MIRPTFAFLSLVLLAGVLGGCPSETKEEPAEEPEAKQKEKPKQETMSAMSYEERLEKEGIDRETLPKITFEIEKKGKFVVELVPQLAPKTCEQILSLAETGFYTGQRVHRVEPGFVIQWGDPQSKEDNWQELPVGTQGSGSQLPYEETRISQLEGIFAMASVADRVGGDSQVYVTLSDVPMLNLRYCAFGKVIEGMEVVKQVVEGDKIVKVTVSK